VPFLGVGNWSPSNTMWPRPMPIPPYQVASYGILMHPTVWPQYNNVTDRVTGSQARQTDRQRSDSIRRTLQTVAQKTAEGSEMPFGMWSWVDRRNRVLDGSRSPMCLRTRPCTPAVITAHTTQRLLYTRVYGRVYGRPVVCVYTTRAV